MILRIWAETQELFFSVSQLLFNLYKILWQIISDLLSVPVHKENNWLPVSVTLPALKYAVDIQAPILNRMKEQWNLSQRDGWWYKPSFSESSFFRVGKPGMKNIGNRGSLSDLFPHCVYVLREEILAYVRTTFPERHIFSAWNWFRKRWVVWQRQLGWLAFCLENGSLDRVLKNRIKERHYILLYQIKLK